MNVKLIKPSLLMCNTYVVENEQACVIVDCGVKVEEIKKIATKHVAAILITHAHFDHIMNLESYENEFQCPVYMSKNAIEKLGNKELNLSSLFRVAQVEIHNLNNINSISEILNINIAGFKIVAIATPGHSNCSVTYIIENNLFVGDVIFENGIGRTDLITSCQRDIESSVAKIKSLGKKTIFPGHGASFEQ